MTVHQLHKQLGKLIAQGHGRKQVVVDRASFYHKLDNVIYLYVDYAELSSYQLLDDEGHILRNASYEERSITALVLLGDSYPPNDICGPTNLPKREAE